MRWLFLLLLAANLLFFSWNWFRNGEYQELRDPALASVSKRKSLFLLSELQPTEKQGSPKELDHPQPEPDTTVPAVPEPDRRTIPPPEASPPSEPSITQPTGTIIEEERGLCFVLGPFGSSNAVQEVLKRATNSPAIVEKRWSSPEQRPGYWVHIPPAGSSNEARNIVRILNQAGISDLQLITSGEMRNAISLGIFSTMENARKRQSKVAQQGFDVTINEVKIRKRRYWLALRGSGGRLLSKRQLEKLVAENGEVKIQRRPCDNLYR